MIISEFLGIRNTINKTDIPDNAFCDAVNVDINPTEISIRNGYVFTKAINNITAAYQTQDRRAFIVADNKLFAILNDLSTAYICDSTATQFCDIDGSIVTNDLFLINAHYTPIDLNIQPPLQPAITIIDGFLQPGFYSVVTTSVNKHNMESGTSEVITVNLTTQGGLRIQVANDVRVYVTECNGTEYRHIDLHTTVVEYVYPDQVGYLIENTNLGAVGYIGADTVAFYNGSLYCTYYSEHDHQTIIYWSEPYFWHLYRLDKNFFVVDGRVFGMAGTETALVIANENKIYAYNDDTGLNVIADYGAIAGTPIARLNKNVVYIHTLRGIISAPQVVELTEAKVSLTPGDVCFAQTIKQNGRPQVLVCHNTNGTPFNAYFNVM